MVDHEEGVDADWVPVGGHLTVHCLEVAAPGAITLQIRLRVEHKTNRFEPQMHSKSIAKN